MKFGKLEKYNGRKMPFCKFNFNVCCLENWIKDM